MIESSAVVYQEASTSGASKESIPKRTKLIPSATEETATAAGIGGGDAEGSKNRVVRVVPFQTLPQSAQEELGKELFDDPLLTMDNVKKLADYMHWSFKYNKVNLLWLLLLISSSC